jgi:hypothetical protein
MRARLLVCLLLACQLLRAQYTVQVQVNVVQPVPPYLPQIKADISGQRVGMLNQDISNHLSIVLRYTGRAQQRIKLSGSIERVSPTPMGVSLRPDYQPAQAIVMGVQAPVISLNQDMLQTAFGNFSENALVWNNLDLNTLRQNGVDYKLPEGTYRVCVTAYDYDRPGFSAPLSAPGTGCSYFTICYTAAAPQLILPVSTMLQSNSQFQDFVPHSTQVQFLWTPPATTCGVPVGALNYDLEVRRVFDGQTVSDAQYNPYVFHQQNIPTTSFFLDTLKYPHVLVPGQKYTIRVRANFTPRPGSPLEIANQGYSQVAAVNYKAGGIFPGGSLAMNKPTAAPDKPIPIGSILPGGEIIESYSPGGVCPASLPITNTADIGGSIGGADLAIGSFKLHVDQASANTDGSFKGSGYIIWHPFVSDLHLKVNFDTLRVNTDKVVYAGTAYTSTDGSHPEWSPFGLADPVAKFTGLDNSGYEAIRTRVSDVAHSVNQALGNAEVDFPLGLNTNLGATPVTMAIMGISFKAGCTNMNMLLDINCPDLGGWLSLGGTGFQADPNKLLLPGAGGVLYLPQNHQLTLGGMSFAFDGCPSAGGGAVDTSKGTYVSWDGSGLSQIVVNADWQPGISSVVPVDNTGKRLTTPADFHMKFTFSDWSNWTAAIAPTSNFEIASLPGFTILSSGGFYDHSAQQNPAGLAFPAGYVGTTDNSWNGLYIKDLTMKLPASFTGAGNASFGFHNFILDNTGVSTLIGGDNILDLSTGNLGGWAFSIDHLGINVVQDGLQNGMQMTGGIRLPLSDDSLAYTCNLSIGEGAGISYQFLVSPKGNYNVKMWAATIGLQPNSSLTINNNTGSFVIAATLNGNVGISTVGLDASLPNVTLNLLSFQGMTLTNSDPKTGGFNFDPGNWSFGGKALPAAVTRNTEEEQGALAGPYVGDLATGFDYPTGFEVPLDAPAAFDGDDQGSADGFSINFKAFKPYVNFSSGAADIGMTFTVSAVLDESGVGLGGSATMDVFGTVNFPKGGTPQVNLTPNIRLDSIAIDCNVDLFHIKGDLAFHRNDNTFGDDVKGHLDLTLLGTIDVDAAVIFGHVNNFNYWGLAAQAYWQQGIMFPPGLSLNGLGGGFHYNMSLGTAVAKVKSSADVSSPEAIISRLTPAAGTFGFDAAAIFAYLSPNVVCMEAGLVMDISSSHGMEKLEFDGSAQIMSASPPDGAGMITANVVAVLLPDPLNFNCNIDVQANLPVMSANVPIQFNVGANGNYFYLGTPAPPGTDFGDPAIHSMMLVQMGFDAKVVNAQADIYGYFDIGTTLPSSPYIPPAIMNVQDNNGNKMAQGVVDKFTGMLASMQGQNDNSHNVYGTVNNPGFLMGAGLHLQADLDLVVVSADGSIDIGFAALLEHFDPSEVDKSCSPDGTIGFNNWYAMAIFYANLSADLNVGPFSVGSVNAGAILAAGVVNPTWASGDVWIDVHALGIISFTGSVSISIGDACRPVKDPLANLEMIGDFGPRTKDGSAVDVSSVPDVVGNIPLNEDYPVMVNDGSTRVYRFKVDAFDVTSSTGVNLGTTNQVNNGDYEVDLYHNAMLCGNANYNAHIRVSAYMEQGPNADPNTPLLTQDTTYTFVTGPRPQTIMLDNLIYSYPVANQRYVLKTEFGGQGRLAVAQDIGYLLSSGKANDCDNGLPPPSAPSSGDGVRFAMNSVLRQPTQLLVKFVPYGGGDTLQTNFSYSYNQQASMGTMIFTLPSALKNTQTYSMQIWVVPPKNLSAPTVGVSTQNKTLTQTTTQYSLNGNNNLIATQVTKQLVVTDTMHSLSGNRQAAGSDSARVIFKLYFATSQYNRFADKMAAYGNWQTQDETNFAFKMPIYSNAAAVEPFDEFEIKDFKSTCTTNQYKNDTIAHLFDADVPWDPNAHNDQDIANMYAFFVAIHGITHATVDLGLPEVRTLFGIPNSNLVSLENMPFQPQLSIVAPWFTQMNSQRTTIQSLTEIGSAGYALPASGAGNGQSWQIQRETALTVGFGAGYNFAGLGTPNTLSPPKPQPGLLWQRDNVFYNDYLLLHNFAGDLVSQQQSLSLQAMLDLAQWSTGTVILQENGYYGSISMTAQNWIDLLSAGNSALLMQDAANFSTMPFTVFPPTARRALSFSYRFPSPAIGYTPGQASGTFNYKTLVVPFTMQSQNIASGVGAEKLSDAKTGSGTQMPAGSRQVQSLLLTKYKLH